MAEYLIAKENYWIKVGMPQAIVKMGEKRAYAGTYQRKDVMIVREDQYYQTDINPKGTPWNRKTTVVMRVKNQPVQFGKHYAEPMLDEKGDVIERHRWQVTESVMEQGPIVDVDVQQLPTVVIVKAKPNG